MVTVRQALGETPEEPKPPLVIPTVVSKNAPTDLDEVGQWAFTYAEAGWPTLLIWGVLPNGRCGCENLKCPSPGKHPIAAGVWTPRNGLKDATTDTLVVAGWYRRAKSVSYLTNVAIVPPEGYVALDIDQPDAPYSAVLLTALKDAPLQATGREGGGFHIFVRGVEGRSEDVNGATVKGNAGGYVVMTPSTHVSGTKYSIIRGGTVPIASDEVIEALKGVSKTGANGQTAAEPFITIAATTHWLDKYRDGVFEGRRYDAVRDGIGHFRYKLHPEETELGVRMLVSHALKPLWRPAWSESDFNDRFDRAWKYDIEHPERLEGVRERVAGAVETPEARIASVHEARVVLRDAVESPTAGDWLLGGLLRPRALGILASEEGLGKSYLRLALGMGLALGSGSFLDAFPFGAAARVLLIDEENGADEEFRRESLLLDDLGMKRDEFPSGYVRYSHLGLDLRSGHDQAMLLHLIENERPQFVILDTATGMVGDEYGDAFKKVIRFQRTITERGVSILNVVHFVKPGRSKDGTSQRSDRNITEVMGHWTRPSDVVMMLTPDDKDESRLLFKGRKRIPGPYNLVLARTGSASWKSVAPAVRSGLGVTINLGSSRGPATEGRGLVFEAIALGQKAWVEGMKLSKPQFYAQRRNLIEEGLVTESGALTLEGEARWAEEVRSRQQTLEI